MGCERQWTGVGGLREMGGVSWPVGLGAGQMGGTTSSSQFGVGVGQMGEHHPGGVGAAGWFGEATRLAQGVVSGQMRGHHQRRVEEA